MIDVFTLALAGGLSNLAFAALAGVYVRSAPMPNPPLAVWRWARLVAGVAFLLIWLRPVIPLWASLSVPHILILVGWALEFAAYAALLGLRGWRRPLIALTALALAAQLALYGMETSRSVYLVYFSLANGAFLTAMAAILLASRRHGGLARLMGWSNAVFGVLFLLRAAYLFRLGDHTLESYKAIHPIPWVIGYTISIVNGFGFLLLAKQDDDRKLKEALADVSLAEAEQRQLLSLASHEFRTPAAMIQASLDSLKLLEGNIPPAAAGRLDNIGKATRRLVHLANTLIVQDRLRDLRFGLVRDDTDLNAVVAQVSERYTPPIPWYGLDQAPRVAVDAELLAIALHNLIDNALRYSAAGGPPEVRLDRSGPMLEITVADCGPGVPDAEKEAVFERFYRRDKGPGSGLGLSIVRTIARLHGGEAMVRDNAPNGAVFVIRLPVELPTPRVEVAIRFEV